MSLEIRGGETTEARNKLEERLDALLVHNYVPMADEPYAEIMALADTYAKAAVADLQAQVERLRQLAVERLDTLNVKEAQVVWLEKKLRPFADAANWMPELGDYELVPPGTRGMMLRAVDFREAAAALEPHRD